MLIVSSFNTWRIFLCCHLVCILSSWNSAFLILVLLYITCLAVVAFKIFFYFIGFEHFWLWCAMVYFSLCFCAYNSLSFLDLWVCSFHQIWKIFSHISSNIFPVPTLSMGDSNDMYIKLLEIVPQLIDAVFLFSVFFSVLHFLLCLLVRVKVYWSVILQCLIYH